MVEDDQHDCDRPQALHVGPEPTVPGCRPRLVTADRRSSSTVSIDTPVIAPRIRPLVQETIHSIDRPGESGRSTADRFPGSSETTSSSRSRSFLSTSSGSASSNRSSGSKASGSSLRDGSDGKLAMPSWPSARD